MGAADRQTVVILDEADCVKNVSLAGGGRLREELLEDFSLEAKDPIRFYPLSKEFRNYEFWCICLWWDAVVAFRGGFVGGCSFRAALIFMVGKSWSLPQHGIRGLLQHR